MIHNAIYDRGYKGWNIAYWYDNPTMGYILRNEFLPSGGNLLVLKPVNDQKRHFFCYTHDNSNNSVGYTDEQRNTKTQSVTMDNANNFSIGCNRWGPSDLGDFRSGQISEIIIENKVWSSDEISAYYNSTKGNYGIS